MRLSVQTAAGSALAFLVMVFFGLPDVSWAIIAALFTIHPNADSTLWSAVGRLLAALLGIGIGFLSIMIVAGEDYFLARLVIAAAASGGIAAIWPNLNYVGVTAVIMALHPDPELADALMRGLAIMIGAAAGTVATLVLWPEYSARRTLEFLEDALANVRELLDLILQSRDAEEQRERDALHAQFLSKLEAARTTAAEAWFAPRLANGASLRDALRVVESLWHGLVILDRAMTDERKSLDETNLAALGPHIEEVRQSACAFCDALIAALRGDQPAWPQPRLDAAVSEAREAAGNLLSKDGNESSSLSRSIYVLNFALDEVERNFMEASRLVAPARVDTDRREAPWSGLGVR